MANINDFTDSHTVHALLTDLANDPNFNDERFKNKSLQDIFDCVSGWDPQPSFISNLKRVIDYGCGGFVYHDCVSTENGFDGIVLDDCEGHRLFLLGGTRDIKDASSDTLEKFGCNDDQIRDLEDFYQQNKGKPPSVHLYGNSKGGYEAEWLYVHHPEEVEHCYVINALPLKYEDLTYDQQQLLKNGVRFTCIIIMNEQDLGLLDYVPFMNNTNEYKNNIKFVKSKSSGGSVIGSHTPDKSYGDNDDYLEFLDSSSLDVSMYYSKLWAGALPILGTGVGAAVAAAGVAGNIIASIKSALTDIRVEIDIQSFNHQADLIREVCQSLENLNKRTRNLYSSGLKDLEPVVKHEIFAWQISHLIDVQNYLRSTASRFASVEDKIKNWSLV